MSPSGDDRAAAKAERKIRCRLLDGKLNRCPNEALSEDGLALCARHMAEAVRDYCRLTGGKLGVSGSS